MIDYYLWNHAGFKDIIYLLKNPQVYVTHIYLVTGLLFLSDVASLIKFVVTARQPSCRKVMFSQVFVCHSVQREGGVSCDRYPWCIGPHCTGPQPQPDPLYRARVLTPTSADIWWPATHNGRAGSTHPTGMLSCFFFVIKWKIDFCTIYI